MWGVCVSLCALLVCACTHLARSFSVKPPSLDCWAWLDMPPRRTLLPPPDMVPEVSMSLPSMVTTRQRLLLP